ncbi:RDD family protein [Paenibacillus oenotherae]|uniref:RDD family protein n=1 Tax=Paenibacillus oenotherae TaxID=1435645 RepID=A0ABS7D824_9BACL|nr:RDD family protein [Paenibacillus oenotherae]MBW7476088.1 RDD family protein [Paenibacillus oenotherae]
MYMTQNEVEVLQYQPGDYRQPGLNEGPNYWNGGPPAPLPSDMESVAIHSKKEVIFVKRAAAAIVDNVLLILLFIGALTIGGFDEESPRMFIMIGIWFLGAVMYYLLLEGLTGYTAGKFALRIQVVRKDGRPPGILKEFIRYLLQLIEAGLIAGLVVLLSEKRQRIGDMAANTFVVNTKDLPPSSRSKTKDVALTILFSIMGLAAVVSAILGLYTAISSAEGTEVFLSKDRQFQVTAPASWHEDDLNDDQDLGITHRFSDKYFMLMSEDKLDFPSDVTLEEYHELIEDMALEEHSDVKLLEPTNALIVNGYEAYQFKFSTEHNGYSVIYSITTVETDTHFHQLHSWTLESYNSDKVQQELSDIINSFSEVARVDDRTI